MAEKRKFKVLMFFPWNSESALNWRTLLEVGFSERAVEFEYEYVGGENDRPVVQRETDWDLVITELYPDPSYLSPRENELLERQPAILSRMFIPTSRKMIEDAVARFQFAPSLLGARSCHVVGEPGRWEEVVSEILFGG